MNRDEIEALAAYNAEVAHGVSHSADVRARMGELQRQFDDLNRSARAEAQPDGRAAEVVAYCPTCHATGVGSMIHRPGCGGSTPDNPLIAFGPDGSEN